MSLARPIKKQVRDCLDKDSFMHKCCIADNYCKGVVQWHHHLIWKGQRSDDREDILPLCEYHHRKVDTKESREKVDWVWLNRLTDEKIRTISKAVNYKQRKVYLNKKYGTYNIQRDSSKH